jgi:hypothetical protein
MDWADSEKGQMVCICSDCSIITGNFSTSWLAVNFLRNTVPWLLDNTRWNCLVIKVECSSLVTQKPAIRPSFLRHTMQFTSLQPVLLKICFNITGIFPVLIWMFSSGIPPFICISHSPHPSYMFITLFTDLTSEQTYESRMKERFSVSVITLIITNWNAYV